MRILCVLGLLLALMYIVECKKHHKKSFDYKVDSKPLSNTFHKGSKHRFNKLRGAHLNLRELREGGVKSLHDDWMHIPKHSKCKTLKCGHKEMCLSSPTTGEEKCINKKHLREGRRLFKEFHNEKMFLKKDIGVDVSEKDLAAAEHMKDVYDLLKDYKKHSHHNVDVKKLMKKVDLTDVKEAGDDQVCRPSELQELKKRLVGWMVLMHTESRQRHHLEKKKHHKQHSNAQKKLDMINHHKKHHSVDMMGLDGDYSDVKKHTDWKKKHFGHFETKRVRRNTHEGQHILTESHHNCKCSKSVMWDFRKKDINADGSLSHEELLNLEHLQREPCLKPFIKSCDTDKDGSLSHGEWCCCLSVTIPPCAEKKRLAGPDDHVPNCDDEGFYKREQCDKGSNYCWCVDLNGNPIPNTKRLGSGHCGKYDPNGQLIKM